MWKLSKIYYDEFYSDADKDAKKLNLFKKNCLLIECLNETQN